MIAKLFATLLFVSLIASGHAQSFEAFRLKSGMTPEQVHKAFPSYEFRWFDRKGGSAFLVKDNDIFANFLFCNNALIALSRSIDPDTDLVRYLDDNLRQFGQPQITIRKEPWTGAGGGNIESIDYLWIRNGVKYLVSFNPEGRTGSGELRYSRGASISFTLVTSCKENR